VLHYPQVLDVALDAYSNTHAGNSFDSFRFESAAYTRLRNRHVKVELAEKLANNHDNIISGDLATKLAGQAACPKLAGARGRSLRVQKSIR
jgi:hypothetical protein